MVGVLVEGRAVARMAQNTRFQSYKYLSLPLQPRVAEDGTTMNAPLGLNTVFLREGFQTLFSYPVFVSLYIRLWLHEPSIVLKL
jgi:hypothetical protein